MADMEAIQKLYEPADCVAETLREIVKRHHQHLANCRFTLLFRTDGTEWLKRGRMIPAQVRKVNDLTNAIIMAEAGIVDGIDMVLVINLRVWEALNEAGQEALLDHELSRIILGAEGGYTLDDPDVQEFSAVARRRGAWNEELKQLENALLEHGQETLPGLERAAGV